MAALTNLFLWSIHKCANIKIILIEMILSQISHFIWHWKWSWNSKSWCYKIHCYLHERFLFHFSFNKKLGEEEIENHIAKIEKVSKIRRMSNLAIEGKIVAGWLANSLAILKVIHLALIKAVSVFTMEHFNQTFK